jgi:hypothetical protein
LDRDVDCEKYDRIALDLLYEELDELTMVAAKRHLEQCARCRELHARFRATREVGVVPLVDPPEGFEARILEAERGLRAQLPLGQRIGRAISILAGYSMRPQLAMAALLLLMIGSSLIFLKARPGQRGAVHITERGVPGAEAESIILPAPKREPSAAPPRDSDSRSLTDRAPTISAEAPAPPQQRFAAAPEKLKADSYRDELTNPERAKKLASGSGLAGSAAPLETEGSEAALTIESPEPKESDAALALTSARELQQAAGCAPAVSRFDQVATRFPGTAPAYEATWRAAECRRLLGELGLARQGYQALLGIDRYRLRAQNALDALRDEETQMAASAARSAASAPSKPAAEAKPSAPSPKAGASP